MGRLPREKSPTGVYHIMLRGIDGRNIFMADNDKDRFMEILIKGKSVSGFQLLGYCLMDNHVHILIKEGEDIGTCMKRMTVSYAIWHNKKHERTGHLFQNRYRSEVVDNEIYLKTVLRYIHRNPVKANIVLRPGNYKWSSYNDYIQMYNGKDRFVDGELIKSLYPEKSQFELFMQVENEDECMDYENKLNYSDTQIREIIFRDYAINSNDIKQLPKQERAIILKKLYQEVGVSVRQLSRIVGISKSVIGTEIKR